MKKHLKAIFFAIPISFLIGAWWGLSDQGQKEVLFKTPEIKILASKKFFSPQILVELETLLQAKIIIKEYDLNEPPKIQGEGYDIVQIHSFNKSSIDTTQFQPLTPPENSPISADYMLDEYKTLLPLSWGYLAFLVHPTIEKKDLNLEQIFSDKSFRNKVYLNDSPFSLIDALESLYPEMDMSPDSFDEKEVHDKLKKMKAFLYNGSKPVEEAFESKELLIAEVFSQDMKYFSEGDLLFLKNKTLLWVSFLGSPQTSTQPELVSKFASALYSRSIYSKLLEKNGQNSVLETEVHNLLPTQQALFVKHFPLEKIEIRKSLQVASKYWKKFFSTEPLKD